MNNFAIFTSSPRKKKIGAELIKWYQGKTNYSHVGIWKDDLIYQASHGWVNVCYDETFLEENSIIDFYFIPDDLIDFEFVKKQIGKKYSYLQLVKIAIKYLFGLKLKQNGDKRFICSEFVGKSLRLTWVDDYTNPKEVHEFLRKFHA